MVRTVRISSSSAASGIGPTGLGRRDGSGVEPLEMRRAAGEIEKLRAFARRGDDVVVSRAPSLPSSLEIVPVWTGKSQDTRDFVGTVAEAGCEVFITGEVGYHDALSAARRGMSVIELGHRESERFYLKVMSGWLREMGLQVRELNIPVQRIGSF